MKTDNTTPDTSEAGENTGKRYTFDTQRAIGLPVLYILRDGERLMGSIHCSSPTIEDIADQLNKLHEAYATLKADNERLKGEKDKLMDANIEVTRKIRNLQSDNEAKDKRIKELEGLMQEFIDRVDKGEVRSSATYTKFKNAISKK